MKKHEREALRNAFGIPEPQRKDEFISSIRERTKQKRFPLPIIMRYVTAAAMAAIIISLWAFLRPPAGLREHFSDGDVMTQTTSGTSVVTTTTAVTSKSVSTDETVTAHEAVTTAETDEDDLIVTTTTSGRHTVIVTAATEENAVTSAQNERTVTTKKTAAVTTATNKRTTARTTVTTAKRTSRTTTVSTTKKTTRTTAATTRNVTRATTTTTRAATTSVVTFTTTAYNTYSPPPAANTVTTTAEHDSSDNEPAIATTQSPAYDPAYNDLTVYPEVTYNATGNIIPSWMISEENEPPADSDSSKSVSISTLKKDSDAIIYGRIDEILYTSIEGVPYTVANISVSSVLKRYSLYNSRISVYIPGGYMPADEYIEYHGGSLNNAEEYLVYDDCGNWASKEAGDSYLFLLKNGSSPLPSGSYMLTTGSDVSIFTHDGSGYLSLGNDELYYA